MPKHSKIRLHRRTLPFQSEASLHHSSLRARPQDAVVGEVNPAQKIHAGDEGGDETFVGMELEM